MTHTHAAFAVVVLGALAGIGWGVRVISRQTVFVASALRHSMSEDTAENDAGEADQGGEGQGPYAVGFRTPTNSGN